MADQDWYYVVDGSQAGPVSVEHLRALYQNGSIRGDDLVWTAEFSDWIAASAVPQLWPANPATGGAPPVPAGNAEPWREPHIDRKTSSLAIASLILGLLSFVWLLCLGSIPGIICGHMARARIRREPDRLTGEGIALAGLVLNYLNIVAIVVGSVAFFIALLIAASPH